MSTIQRVTGMNSGLDVDALVKSAMTSYQSKIDKETQNKKVLEYQQEQYKQIMSDASAFYDKYFDILKSGNLMSSSTYQSVSFTSSDDSKVTAKGFAGADVSNYKVTTTQIASTASVSFKATDLSGTNLSIKVDGKDPVSVAIVKADDEIDMATTAKNLNTALNAAGINVSAKYSEFSNSIVLESGTKGEDVSFQAGVDSNYKTYTGQNAKGVITKGTETYTFNQASNVLTVDNVQFTFKAPSVVDTTTVTDLADLTDLTNLTNLTDLKATDSGVTVSEDGKTITSADGKTTTVISDNGTITTTDGTKTTITTTDKVKKTTSGTTITTTSADGTKTTTNGIKTTTTEVNGIKITTSADGKIKTTTSADGKTITTEGTGTSTTKMITQVNDDGSITKTITTGGSDTTNTYSPVSLSGETDVTDLKNTIVGFVNDYNTLLSSINTKLYEERDTDYMPLTDTQKAAMTDDQITAWEKKAQTGLLRKDDDLERIASEMKSAMSTVMSGSGLYLESIGIKPVDDYADKNGLFTVDEKKLTQALEDNAGNIKDLFTRAASTTDKGGVLTQLKSSLYSEFKTSTSLLSKKAGLDGTTTQYDNTLTKSINDKKQLIADLNTKFTDQENALYKKYSDLESALETLNAQQSSLASMLGTS